MHMHAGKVIGSCLLASALIAGCSGQQAAQPNQRETNETRADQGMQSYSGFTPPADDRQFVTDTRNMQKGDQIRSAHAIAYELESIPAVQGAAMLVVGRTAYIGVHPASGYQVTDEVRDVISAKVYAIDRTINRVNITDQPGTVDYLSGYTHALETGRPLDAYQARFKEVVGTTWPTGQ